MDLNEQKKSVSAACFAQKIKIKNSLSAACFAQKIGIKKNSQRSLLRPAGDAGSMKARLRFY
jgi:hypothetical protein